MNPTAEFILGLITDALKRPEPKAVMGIIFLVAALVYGLVRGFQGKPDWIGFTAMATVGTALLGVTAVADARTDSAAAGNQQPQV